MLSARFDPRWIRYVEPATRASDPRARKEAIPVRSSRVSRSDTDRPRTRQDMLEICIAARTSDDITRAVDRVNAWLEDNPHDDLVRLVRDRLVARGFMIEE